MLIDVPVYRQEEKWSCLAACIRMCMDATGERLSEADWVAALGITKRGGTLEQAFTTLTERGVDCELFTVHAVESLDTRVSLGSSTILGLRVDRAGELPTYHAVVLVGCIGDDYLVNDPAVGIRTFWRRHDLERALEMAGSWALAMPAV